VGWGHKFSVVVLGVAMLICAATAAAATPKAAFSARVRAIGTEVQKAIIAMPVASSQSKEEAAKDAAQLQTIYTRLANRLAALTPPKRIKTDYKLLVASFRVAATNAAAWHDAILHGSVKDAANASAKLYLNPAATRASAALVRMSQEGYYFGTFFR
jgi:hypothetical protein